MSSQTAVAGRGTVAGSGGTRKKVPRGKEHLSRVQTLQNAQADTKTTSLLHKIINHEEECVNFFTN